MLLQLNLPVNVQNALNFVSSLPKEQLIGIGLIVLVFFWLMKGKKNEGASSHSVEVPSEAPGHH